MPTVLVLAIALSGCTTQEEPGQTPPAATPWFAQAFAYPATAPDEPRDLRHIGTDDPNLPEGVLFDAGVDAGEPVLAFSADGTAFLVAWENTLRSTDLHNWTPVLSVERTSDPMFAVDPVTDRIHTLHMRDQSCADLWSSDDGGDTWVDQGGSCLLPRVDFIKMAVGVPGPDANPAVGAYPTVAYICHNANEFGAVAVLSTTCLMSYDGGASWPVETVVAKRTFPGVDALNDPCGGVTGFPAVRNDGVVAVPVGNGCDSIYVGVSTDSGLTWTLRSGPPASLVSATPEVAFDGQGRMHALWRDDQNRALLAWSDDLGASWTGPVDLTPPGVRTTMFEALDVTSDGRVYAAFLGSPTDTERPMDAPPEATWALWIVSLAEAEEGALVRAFQATPAHDPVQRGPICLGGSGCERNLGDFITSALSPDGAFHVAFTDGCLDGCLGSDSQSLDERVRVLRFVDPAARR